MTGNKSINRRKFISSSAKAAGLAAAAVGAPGLLEARAANDIIGIGQIGIGTRGYELMNEAKASPNVQYRAICDLYDGYIKRGSERAGNPKLRTSKRYQELLDSKDIDAVIIAVPDHWHYQIAMDAVAAGKDVYLEKPFVNTLDQAKKLVKAVRDNKTVFQLGHQGRSNPAVWKAREIVARGTLGDIIHVRTQHYRNSMVPYLRWYGFYDNYEMPDDADLDHIDWDAFQANVRKHPFHPFRFFHWRCYYAYTNGVAGDLLSHAMDGINAIIGMGIPETAVSTGGVYYWLDGRETPDTWNAVFDYPGQGLSINYTSLSMSENYGTGTQIMGKDAALDLSGRQVKVFAEYFSDKYHGKVQEMRSRPDAGPGVERREPIESYDPQVDPLESNHAHDWLTHVRDRGRTRGNIDTAWQEIVTVLMSYESFRRGRKVAWDKEKEIIV